MSTSNKDIYHSLKIRILTEYKYLVKVTIFDSFNRVIEDQSSNVNGASFFIPKGLYTLRIETNGDIKDEVILLDKDMRCEIGAENSYLSGDIKNISLPRQFSSAPISDAYYSSHEYYTKAAIEWSKKETFKEDFPYSTNCSLFIFLRFSSIEKYKKLKNSFSKPFYSDFEIVDEYGDLVTKFNTKSGIKINEKQGWVAFNAKLAYGIYYLLYKGDEPRQIPIYIYKNWHTQFFMTLDQKPLFGTIRIFLSKYYVFNPDEKTHKYIDILLNKLQNQDFSLDNKLIEMAAHGKYQSPMLGLICSYIYLKSNETKRDNLFNIITQNMQKVILKDNWESPDLRALNILASNHLPEFKYNKKGTSIKGTPMLRIGFEAILNASVKNHKLIPQNSINDYISENVYFDSPFNTFKPIPFPKRPTYNLNLEGLVSSENLLQEQSVKFLLSDEDFLPKHRINKPKIDKFNTSITNLFDESLFSFIQDTNNTEIRDSWIKNSIVDIIKSKNDVSLNDISNDLNISGNTVNRIFSDWKVEAEKKYGK